MKWINKGEKKNKHVRFSCAYACAYASLLMLMRKREQYKTNRWVPSNLSVHFAYAYVAGVLTCYAYAMLMR